MVTGIFNNSSLIKPQYGQAQQLSGANSTKPGLNSTESSGLNVSNPIASTTPSIFSTAQPQQPQQPQPPIQPQSDPNQLMGMMLQMITTMFQFFSKFLGSNQQGNSGISALPQTGIASQNPTQAIAPVNNTAATEKEANNPFASQETNTVAKEATKKTCKNGRCS
jgi:hypothetical protein